MNQPESASFIPQKTIVLIGMMGAGKSAVGRRLASRVGLPFVDSDSEIEKAAGMSIAQFFDRYGEAEFREGERRIIGRLLDGPLCVLSTGGGAFVDPYTRALITAKAVSIWLKADLDVLLERALRHNGRPLLRGVDPRTRMAGLLTQREPIYAQANITVTSDARPVDDTIERVLKALREHSASGIQHLEKN